MVFAVPDALAAFYLTCFLIGVVFVVVSAVVGVASDVTHLPGLHLGHGHAGAGHVGADFGHAHAGAGHGFHADVGIGHGGNGAAHAAGDGHAPGQVAVSASPFNLMTAMAFLIWFGGAGYILHTVYGIFLPLTLLAAVAAGSLAGWLVYEFLVKVLLPGTVEPDPREYEVVGALGHVSIEIEPGSVGEVVYTLGGARHSDGARSANDLPIPRDTEVVIVRYEKGIAYVQPWQSFVDEQAKEA